MDYPQKQLSITQLTSQLMEQGDFLHLSRSHEFFMPAFSFDVVCKHNLTKIQVSILDTGLIVFEPLSANVAKDIVLSSAVHGNETAPIEICRDLIKQLILGDLHLEHRILFIFGNPPSINTGQRFVEENLNRLFSSKEFSSKELSNDPSKTQGTDLINKERHRALLLENTVADFFAAGQGERFHYDLHTAIRGSKNDKFAVYPFQHNNPWVKAELQFMFACGINTILFSNSPTTTFSYFSSNEFGAHSFTIELGKVKPFGENDTGNFAKVTQCLTALLSEQSLHLSKYHESDFNFFKIEQVIVRHHQDFNLHFNDDVENFTEFPIGTVIATDGEQKIKTQQQGEAIIFPNANVAIGQRAMLTVVPVSIIAE